MATVYLEGDASAGLARMVAGLVEANIAADPTKERLLESTRGAVQIDVSDTGATIGLRFVPGALTIGDQPVPGADLRITCDADTLLSLSTVPLRLGMPDPMSEAGRRVAMLVATGKLRLSGLPAGARLLRVLNRLLNVA